MAEPASLTIQTLYAELVDRCATAAFETEFPLNGSFVRVAVKGRDYWYFQEGTRDTSGKQKRKYVGSDTEENRQRISNHGKAKNDYKERRRIISMLRHAGFRSSFEESGSVIEALSAAGIFRMRACLVGTAAYQVYGPMLGVRLPHRSLQTQDIDIAQFTAISLAIGEDEKTPPMLDVLKLADSSFRPIPHTRKAQATVAYVGASGVRVDVLTENRGPERETPEALPSIGAHAQPLRFLDFLIRDEVRGVILYDAGVLVNVPAPERYALHKLIVAQRRRTDSAKTDKDLEQAEALLDVLTARRSTDLREVWREAVGRGPRWRQFLTAGLGMISGRVRDRTLHAIDATRSVIPDLGIDFSNAPPHYDFSRDVVVFRGQSQGERVICAISREALDDHFNADGQTNEQRVETFRRHRDEIEQMAREIYLHKTVVLDGPVLITTNDVDVLRRSGKSKKSRFQAKRTNRAG